MLLEKIELLCKQNNITVTGLEKRLGFGSGSIRKWNKSSPSIDNLLRVAENFNTSLDYLSKDSIGGLSNASLLLAREFEDLDENRKNLVKCYMSII